MLWASQPIGDEPLGGAFEVDEESWLGHRASRLLEETVSRLAAVKP